MIASNSYLQRLTAELHRKAENIPPSKLAKHKSFILSRQQKDGGFCGRDLGGDLYYTGFALRSLAIMGALEPQICDRVAVFLKSQMHSKTSLLDFFSLIYSAVLVSVGGGPDVFEAHGDWTISVKEFLSGLRRPDGGFAKNPQSQESSTYMTFLALLCHQLIGNNPADLHLLESFVMSRSREDGGFVEYSPMRKSGTNPTAAGYGVLMAISKKELVQDIASKGKAFFTGMLGEEGGFKANSRIPFCDVLSTFTSLWSLSDLKGLDLINLEKVKSYLNITELPDGGFRGGSWDAGADVEYTFYGLGALALVHGMGANS